MSPKSSETGNGILEKKAGGVSDRRNTDTAQNPLQALRLGPCHYLADVIAFPNQMTLWATIAARTGQNAAK